MIKFVCPNGHPLSAPDNLAGKGGKCPRCHTSFVVPQPGDDDSPVEDKLSAAASGTSIMPAAGSGKDLVKADELFVFLCPNGHKLNGPASMKGKAGQCPHCNARFLVPTDEEIDAADEETLGEGTDGELADDDAGAGGIGLSSAGIGIPPEGAPGLGYVVARLWERRTQDSELEIFLNEGEIVAPDYFSEVLSTSDYGVFAIQEGDGTYAITVVPWSTVRRVGLRRVGELPGDLFG